MKLLTVLSNKPLIFKQGMNEWMHGSLLTCRGVPSVFARLFISVARRWTSWLVAATALELFTKTWSFLGGATDYADEITKVGLVKKLDNHSKSFRALLPADVRLLLRVHLLAKASGDDCWGTAFPVARSSHVPADNPSLACFRFVPRNLIGVAVVGNEDGARFHSWCDGVVDRHGRI